jgi:2-polyprenyl-3-methyl-5-hydroxy-6-metoxy-1,4-benzoquinol methylase
MYKKVKKFIIGLLELILTKSIVSAVKEQGLSGLVSELEKYVPDITDQYSTFKIDNNYLRKKVRGVHAFQVSLINKVVNRMEKPFIVDIGDSAGTHIQYIKAMHPENTEIRFLSINLDQEAVNKIEQKGLKAIAVRAEELIKHDIKPDIFLCFELLEHMMDPPHFLYDLSQKTNAKYLILTVPYLKVSRIGLYHIRRNLDKKVYAENTHIYELNPEDWKLLVKHSGWDVVHEQIYLQYPRFKPLRITKILWKKLDFQGFYGLILERNNEWSSKYMDW